MFNFDKNALIELGKSVLRMIWFGFLALIITALTAIASDGQITNATVTIGDSVIQVGFILVGVIGFVIKAIDRYIHKSENNDLNGIAPSILQK